MWEQWSFPMGVIASRARDPSLRYVSDNTAGPDNTILVSTAALGVDVAAVDHTHPFGAETDSASTLADYFEVVWVVRIK